MSLDHPVPGSMFSSQTPQCWDKDMSQKGGPPASDSTRVRVTARGDERGRRFDVVSGGGSVPQPPQRPRLRPLRRLELRRGRPPLRTPLRARVLGAEVRAERGAGRSHGFVISWHPGNWAEQLSGGRTSLRGSVGTGQVPRQESRPCAAGLLCNGNAKIRDAGPETPPGKTFPGPYS